MILKPKAVGTKTDITGKVEISKVFGGYFSNPQMAQSFVDLGIKPILVHLPISIKYADFGGGEGYLTKYVTDFLKNQRKIVDTTVVDANPEFLKKAHKIGLKIMQCNLQNVKLPNLDLITMRAVNHYNPLSEQIKILRKAYENLNKGGYLISQISTGNESNCKLRNLIKKRLLGSGEEWVTIATYIDLLKTAGFSEIKLEGYAPPNSWSLEEQWNRYNSTKLSNAIAEGNSKEIARINKQKVKFLADVQKLFKMKEYKDAGVEKTKEGNYRVPYRYAIISARKLNDNLNKK